MRTPFNQFDPLIHVLSLVERGQIVNINIPVIAGQAIRKIDSQAAEIDRLRIECGDVPEGGWEIWAAHQKPASLELSAELDRALGIVRI